MKIVIDKDERKMLHDLEKYLYQTIKFGGKSGKQARVDGCKGNLDLTESYMKKNHISFKGYWQQIFQATGGYCDCEVLMNSFHALGVRK